MNVDEKESKISLWIQEAYEIYGDILEMKHKDS